MSLWRDTFTVHLNIKANPFHSPIEVRKETFTGSLKGAIRKVLATNYHGTVTATFYDSNGNFLKEIGK